MLSQANIYVQILHEIRHSLPDIERLPIPIDLAYLASCLGYKIEETRIQQHGYITETTNGEHLIRVRTDDKPVVKRFTIAHEIGHILLNMYAEKPSERTVKFRSDSNSWEERIADRLAAELLMPVARFEAELSRHVTPSFSSLRAMVKSFGVSWISCLRRITELPHFMGFSYLYELSRESKDGLGVHLQTRYSNTRNLRFIENPAVVLHNCYSYSFAKGRDWEGKVRMIADHQVIVPAFCNFYRQRDKFLARLSGWARLAE